MFVQEDAASGRQAGCLALTLQLDFSSSFGGHGNHGQSSCAVDHILRQLLLYKPSTPPAYLLHVLSHLVHIYLTAQPLSLCADTASRLSNT